MKFAWWIALALLVTACTSDPATDRSSRPERSKDARSDRLTSCDELETLVERVRRGWYPERSPELSFVVREPNFIGSAAMPTHTGPWDFLVDVPLVFYGPGIVPQNGSVDQSATVADLAPTTARLIGFDFPKVSGRVLRPALPEGDASPRLVVTIVWDGGGDNALEAHPRSWPFLRSLMRRGLSFENATVGSTPSNTPPVHATIGTGAWPRLHGVSSVKQRGEDGEYVDPWLEASPSALERPTLGDLYDRAEGNRPEIGVVATVNWHLGMIGHGAALPGGDSDLGLLMDDSGLVFGNPSFYEIPVGPEEDRLLGEAEVADRADGSADGAWRGHPLDDPAVRYASPAYVAFQEKVLEERIAEHGFGADAVADLLYVNFKQSDDAGHKWGIQSPEVGEVLRAQDDALRRLVETLDTTVGKDRWVIALTADHGQMPYPQDSGGWAIGGSEMKDDANRALDREDDGRDLVDRVVAHGAYVNKDQVRANNTTLERVARWMLDYTIGANVKDGERLPGYVHGGPDATLLDAVVLDGGRTVTARCG